jgi:regulator of ribonuclease activity A
VATGVPATSDLCDRLGEAARVLAPGFLNLGGQRHFAGRIVTLRVLDDNALVRATLSGEGQRRVLVVDGGGSQRCALVGGNLAALAAQNGWSGVVVAGAVRDALELGAAAVGIRALALCPRRAQRTGAGERDVPVECGGIVVEPGQWLVADDDGIVVTDAPPE